MEFVSCNEIRIERELSDLDIFALDFIRILRKHSGYTIVSGYVSILLGRARASEDIDIIIPRTKLSEFLSLLKDVTDAGFYCLNEEKSEDIFDHMNSGLAARFARKGKVIPNIEIKFAKSRIDEISLSKTLTVRIGKEELVVSCLELQVAFKETVLKSPKDMEDARHIREVAKGHLNLVQVEKYRRLLHEIYR
jgi:hypothetical protein